VRERRAADIVNPASGLANDYLNLFNEIVMLIEQLPSMPELIDDIMAWHPTAYQDYFKSSTLPGRGSALEAYKALDPKFRRDFEDVVADLDKRAVGAVAAIRRLHKTGGDTRPDLLTELCTRAADNMRETLLEATNLVNYGQRSSREDPQQRADRLLAAKLRRD
jgi:hypothetical protein